MLIRLWTDGFGTEQWELQLGDTGVTLTRNRESVLLPVGEIRHFQTEGRGQSLKRFVLETADKLYEGTFLGEGDAETFLDYLRTRSGCYVDIRLDTD